MMCEKMKVVVQCIPRWSFVFIKKTSSDKNDTKV